MLGGSSIIPQRERLDPVFAGSGVGLKKTEPYGGTVDLLVATPGRFIEHLQNTEAWPAALLTPVAFLTA